MGWLQRFQRSTPVNKQSAPFSSIATDQDVEACYRLFLGRLPDPDGEKAHKTRIRNGFPVDRLAEEFLRSPEFRERHRISVQRSTSYQWVNLQRFGIYASPEDTLIGGGMIRSKTYEPHVTAVLEATIKPGMTVIDIGANIGYFSLLSAALVGNQGRVIAFEPGHKNGQMLLLSAQRNGFDQILLYPFAVAEKRATLMLDSDGLTGTNGVIHPLSDLE